MTINYSMMSSVKPLIICNSFFLLSLFYKSSNSAHKISMASHTYRVNWTFAFFYIHISYVCLWAINYDTQRRAFTYRFYYDYFIFIYMSVILFSFFHLFTNMIKPMKNNDSIENMKKKISGARLSVHRFILRERERGRECENKQKNTKEPKFGIKRYKQK